MNYFLKKVISLAEELGKKDGFGAVTIIDSIEELYETHMKELEECINKEIALLPEPDEIWDKARELDKNDFTKWMYDMGEKIELKK